MPRLARRPTSRVAALVFAAVVGFPAAAPAQDFTVRAGVSSATITFSPASDTSDLPGGSRRTGLVAGISFMRPRSQYGGIQIEVLVHQKGVRNLLRRDDAIRLTYVEIPVLIHLDLLQRNSRALYVVAGPSFAFCVQASYEDDGIKDDIRDDIADVDIGITAGGGVEVARLSFDARYTWGLRSAFHDAELDGTFKNRTLTLMVGYRLGR